MIKVIPHSEYMKNISESIVIALPYREGSELVMPDNVIKKCRYCECAVQIRPYNERAKEFVCVECAALHLKDK